MSCRAGRCGTQFSVSVQRFSTAFQFSVSVQRFSSAFQCSVSVQCFSSAFQFSACIALHDDGNVTRCSTA